MNCNYLRLLENNYRGGLGFLKIVSLALDYIRSEEFRAHKSIWEEL